jgi:plastocyanin
MGTGLLLGALAWAAIPTSSAGAPGAADSAGKPPSAALIATTAPQTATETISGGFTSFRYDKARITLAKGGTLKVTNNSASPHTLTSNATAGGNPLFNVSVQPHRTVVVPGVSRLAPGTYKFHCTIHPYMTATLVIVGTGGGTHPTPQRFVQPLRTPPVLTGSNI